MTDVMACVVNPLAPLVTPPRKVDQEIHDLAVEPHDLFWEKECAVRPNALGVASLTIDPWAWLLPLTCLKTEPNRCGSYGPIDAEPSSAPTLGA